MECYTIFETNVFTGIITSNNEIGFKDRVAIIDSSGSIPRPEILSSFILPFDDHKMETIFNADIFQYSDIDPKFTGKLLPVIVRETKPTTDILILLILDKTGFNCGEFKKKPTKIYAEKDDDFRYSQTLFKMEKDSSVELAVVKGTITITWNGTDLNVNKITRH